MKHLGRNVDNRWVVPYSPYLLLKYKCHINVEACLSVRGVKYLYKYVFKGPDRELVKLHTKDGKLDEISLYEDMRSMGSSEGCWRTFAFKLYDRNPSVFALQVHLFEEQMMTFENGFERDAADEGPPETSLTAWLTCIRNMRHEDRKPTTHANGTPKWSAKYCDWPEQYKFEKKKWIRKVGKKTNTFTVGRMHNVHPNAGERFYLRLILHNVVANDLALENVESETDDAFTLEALKYFEGVKYETYKAAAMQRNLLQDDGEWEAAMNDADLSASASQIRELYLYIVLNNQPEAPQSLFENHWEHMAEDVQHRLETSGIEHSEWELRAQTLCLIEHGLQASFVIEPLILSKPI